MLLKLPTMVVRAFLAFLLLGAVGLQTERAYGQSYLDRLEQLVKQLEQDTKPASSEELPAPAAPVATVPSPVPANPGLSTPAPAGEAGPSGNIYLGLEAEGYLDGRQGVKVTAVVRNSPAWKGDLRIGDEIVAFDGFPITNLDDLGEKLGKKRPDEVCVFTVMRSGQAKERSVVLLDAALAGQIMSREPIAASTPAWLGVQTSDLSQFFRTQFGLKIFAGAAVTEVTTNSPAKNAGIRPGDCIVEFQTTPIQSAEDLKRVLDKSQPGDAVELLVYRGVTRRNVRLVLEPDPSAAPSPTTPSQEAQTARQAPVLAPALPTVVLQPAQPNVVGPDTMPRPPTSGDITQAPELLGPGDIPADNQPGAAPNAAENQRIRALEDEVQRLRSELAEAQQQLSDTKNQLKSILQSLQPKIP